MGFLPFLADLQATCLAIREELVDGVDSFAGNEVRELFVSQISHEIALLRQESVLADVVPLLTEDHLLEAHVRKDFIDHGDRHFRVRTILGVELHGFLAKTKSSPHWELFELGLARVVLSAPLVPLAEQVGGVLVGGKFAD